MPPYEQDWASLCQEYRRRRGLKQEAMAQDLQVDQSTVSRWERGEREPSLQAKHLILNTLWDAGLSDSDRSIQFLLEQSGSVVAVWDRRATLRGYSPRFERELREAVDLVDLRHQPAHVLLGGSDVVERAAAILGAAGFFEGDIALAVFTFPPFLQDRRRRVGGLVTASTFPVRLSDGDVAMMSILDHDGFAGEDGSSELTVTWLSARDGHSQTVREPAPSRLRVAPDP